MLTDKLRNSIAHLSSLRRIGDQQIMDIAREFPGIPNDYLAFLSLAGCGDLGPIQLYSAPVQPADLYPPALLYSLTGLVIFADDLQGYCYAFDTHRSFTVVEIDPKGNIDDSVENTFTALLEAHLAQH